MSGIEMTLEELKERISKCCDEVTIMEILNIDAEKLVNRFEDEIEARYDWLVTELQDDG